MSLPTINFPRWDGAWPEDLYFSFLALTNDEAIKATEAGRFYDLPGTPMDALANLEKARGKRIENLLEKYRAHGGYKLLNGIAGFRVVMNERRRLAKGNGLFGDPFGEIRLAHIIGAIVGGFNPDFVPKRATLTHQRRVQRATRVLKSLLMPGAQPVDVFEMSDLRRLLGGLDKQLVLSINSAENGGTRPHRADKDAAQRYWLIGFCSRLIATFGDAPPAIVKKVANILSYAPDDATVARYVARATDARGN